MFNRIVDQIEIWLIQKNAYAIVNRANKLNDDQDSISISLRWLLHDNGFLYYSSQ